MDGRKGRLPSQKVTEVLREYGESSMKINVNTIKEWHIGSSNDERDLQTLEKENKKWLFQIRCLRMARANVTIASGDHVFQYVPRPRGQHLQGNSRAGMVGNEEKGHRRRWREYSEKCDLREELDVFVLCVG